MRDVGGSSVEAFNKQLNYQHQPHRHYEGWHLLHCQLQMPCTATAATIRCSSMQQVNHME